jgi:hypothetical protein
LASPRFLLFPLLFASLITASSVMADEPHRIHTAEARQQGVGQNIGFVEKLVHQSAAAQQILQSDNQEAKALRTQALSYLDDARAAEAKGDSAAAAESLNKAKQAIFKAMRLVGGKVVKDKRKENYNKKRQSLLSLLEAHQRIRQEDKASINEALAQEAGEAQAYTKEKMQEAQSLYERDDLVQAMEVLNNAYLSLKVSLTHLREGKTLVRSLNFATKEDEYRYELRRNDTHNMLINTVLKEKHEDPRLGPLMDIPLKEAARLRAEAEQQAAQGDYEAAIKTLEAATKQVIRAIRMAGIFIPG